MCGLVGTRHPAFPDRPSPSGQQEREASDSQVQSVTTDERPPECHTGPVRSASKTLKTVDFKGAIGRFHMNI